MSKTVLLQSGSHSIFPSTRFCLGLVAALLAASCRSEKIPKTYGIYLDSDCGLIRIDPVPLKVRGTLLQVQAGFENKPPATCDSVSRIAIFEQPLLRPSLRLSKLHLDQGVSLWRPVRSIEFDVAPSETRQDLIYIVPRAKLAGGSYALHTGDFASGSMLSARGEFAFAIRSDEKPPDFLSDIGACPYEGCVYGESWIAQKKGVLYEKPPASLGVEPKRIKAVLSFEPGFRAVAKSGLVISNRTRGSYQGRKVSVYTIHGEGCRTLWEDGDLSRVCGMDPIPGNKQEWWVELETESRQNGWTAGKSEFASQADVNNSLSDVILDTTLSVNEKGKRIAAIVKAGAEVNGSGGQYGMSPSEAVMRSGNADVLRLLLPMGLRIGNQPDRCSSWAVADSCLQPGGYKLLDELLLLGMKFDCVPALGDQRWPVPSLLEAGINRPDYPVDRVIEVARVLVKHGYSLDARNRKGQSVFDILDQQKPNNPGLSKLRSELLILAQSASR